MRKIGNSLFCLLFLVSFLLGQNINFTASVDRTVIGEHDQVQLTLTLEGGNLASVKQPSLPDMPDWDVLGSTSSSSTSISIIGGRMETKITKNFIYILAPKKTGKLTIPSVTLSIGGKTYSTDPITVEVVAGAQAPQKQAPSQPKTPVEPKLGSGAEVGDRIFVSCWANKKRAYVGEEITVEFWVYTRVNLVQLSMAKEAKMEGFWVSTDFTAKSLDYQTKVVNGVRYSAALISKYTIYGITPGKKVIEPMELVGVIQLPPRDFFDFWGRTQQVTISSKPVEIEILPLPEKNKPNDFTGAVGDFTISASIDKKEIKTNEAFTLKLIITGKGNLESIKEPNIEFPPIFEKYESHSSIKGNSKTFEIVLMPRETGEFTIPAISFSYFSPTKAEYRRVSTEPMIITVQKGRELPALSGVSYAPTKSALQVYGRDIAYIKPDRIRIKGSSSLVSLDTTHFLLLPVEMFGILAAVFLKKRKERLAKDLAFYRSTRAQSVAKACLREAKKEQDRARCFGAIYEAIFKFIVDKLNMPEGSLIDDIFAELKNRNFDDRFLSELRAFFSELEFARFAPSSSSGLEKEPALKRAQRLLKELSKKLK